jgi:hypothetical protein
VIRLVFCIGGGRAGVGGVDACVTGAQGAGGGPVGLLMSEVLDLLAMAALPVGRRDPAGAADTTASYGRPLARFAFHTAVARFYTHQTQPHGRFADIGVFMNVDVA